ASAKLTRCDRSIVSATVEFISLAASVRPIVIASAIPKGERAEWMVEKLSEIGITQFVPLITERSVVKADGKNKLDRWRRIATESAKQSRRVGVMQIEDPVDLLRAIEQSSGTQVYLSTTLDARALHQAISASQSAVSMFIGPEGGWSSDEVSLFEKHNLTPAALTTTILRIET